MAIVDLGGDYPVKLAGNALQLIKVIFCVGGKYRDGDVGGDSRSGWRLSR